MGIFYRSHSCDSGCGEPHGREHPDDCTCEWCHTIHRHDAFEGTERLQCCLEEIDYLVDEGKWCPRHRQPFIDPADTLCGACEREK